MVHGAFHQRLRAGGSILREDFPFHRAGIDANPDRDILRSCGVHNHFYPVVGADIARIQANFMYACRDRLQRKLIVKMNVRNGRNWRLFADFTQRVRRFHIRHRAADHLASSRRQRVNLRERCRRVAGVCIGHRLHRDGRAAANRDTSDVDLLGHNIILSC